MLQQSLALVVIAYFLARLIWQKNKKEISGNEFLFWLIFWLLSGVAIIFIKYLDALLRMMGFSASGIDILLYASVIVIIYLVFRLRIKQERMDQKLTRVIREQALNNHSNNPKNNAA